MSAKKRTTRAAAAPVSPTSGESAPAEKTMEELVGNQAMVDQLEAGEEEGESGGLWDDIVSWFSSLFSEDEELSPSVDTPSVDTPSVDTPSVDETPDEEEVEEEVEAVEEVVEEAEEQADPALAARPASIKAGQSGALIGTESKVTIYSGDGTDASELAQVSNGKPVDVLEVGETRIKVRYRQGDRTAEGWANKALFSNQPDLGRDAQNPEMMDDYVFKRVEEEATPGENPDGADVAQGHLADCFFIASMNAVANANGEFLKDAIKYDKSTGLYTVRFFEETGYDWKNDKYTYAIHEEVVDGYLPVKEGTDDEAYAENQGGASNWGSIYEKAYAQWKGGYDVLDKGGNAGSAMEALTGVKSERPNLSSWSAEDVAPWFTKAQEDGLAVIAGSQESMESATQTPLTGTESGPYTGTVSQIHEYAHIKPGTMKIRDSKGQVAAAWDTGSEGAKTASIDGSDVDTGSVDYKANSLSVTYKEGKKPESASDLEVDFRYRGLIFPSKKVFAWHAYVFKSVTDGKIQLYNPWGSWQPSPLTGEEFLTYFSNLSTNSVPQLEETESQA